jgi:hypothetical protein
VLEWRPEVQGIGNREQGTDTIEIQRTTMPSTTADTSKRATTTATTAGSGSERAKGLPGATKEPAEIWLRVGGGAASRTDAGGTMDRTVQMGETYRYSAQRVRTVELGGQRLEIRSAESAEVVVERKNLFAPETPMGLVAAPGFFGEKGVQQPSINLSWEPNLEARVVGYRVYRREGDGAWQRIDEEPVDGAAYSDRRVVAGHTYSYRVTAVDAAGSESAPSDAVVETAATQ